jgi:hypothetical protein
MTHKQAQARRMAIPRPTPEQRRAQHEQNLLTALERIGWTVERRAPYELYMRKEGKP